MEPSPSLSYMPSLSPSSSVFLRVSDQLLPELTGSIADFSGSICDTEAKWHTPRHHDMRWVGTACWLLDLKQVEMA